MKLRHGWMVLSCLLGCAAEEATTADVSEREGGPKADGTATVAEFGTAESRTLTVIASADDGLDQPRDLEFNPRRRTELWVINQGFDGTVMLTNPGTERQRADVRTDAYANHFMAKPTSLAFGASNTFGTCQESRNTYGDAAPPNDFMGPTLWPSSLEIYARVNQDPDSEWSGSHIDMLHQSPLCMGITHEQDNVFWVFDGRHGDVVRYDFKEDHGPGRHHHNDGTVRRYHEASVTRVAGVPGHLELDGETGWLYVADTGGGRIIRLNTRTGEVEGALSPFGEDLAEYSLMTGYTVETFATGLGRPSGLVLHESRVFVSDNESGDIVAFNLEGTELGRVATGARGIMGLTVGPDGKLYFVDGQANTVNRLDP